MSTLCFTPNLDTTAMHLAEEALKAVGGKTLIIKYAGACDVIALNHETVWVDGEPVSVEFFYQIAPMVEEIFETTPLYGFEQNQGGFGTMVFVLDDDGRFSPESHIEHVEVDVDTPIFEDC